MTKTIDIKGHKDKQSKMDAFNQGRYVEKVKTCNIDGVQIYARLKSEIQSLMHFNTNNAELYIFKHELKYLNKMYYKKTDIIEAVLNTIYDELELKTAGYFVVLNKYFNEYTIWLTKSSIS